MLRRSTCSYHRMNLFRQLSGRLPIRTRSIAKRARWSPIRLRIAALTPREREVFDLVIQGKANKQIAGALGTTVRTIKGPPPQRDAENAGPVAG
jgi:FixJ family two-component response regulator